MLNSYQEYSKITLKKNKNKGSHEDCLQSKHFFLLIYVDNSHAVLETNEFLLQATLT